MYKTVIGIDNGVTGSIGVVQRMEDGSRDTDFILTPVKEQQNYIRSRSLIHRIDTTSLRAYLEGVLSHNASRPSDCLITLERPMVDPSRFKATVSAIRALEATLCVIEDMKIPYQYIDSREWQRKLLPTGTSGPALKTSSRDVGIRLFPQHRDLIEKHKDADGLLICEYSDRVFNK